MRWLLPINYSKAKLMLALQQLFPIQIHLTFPTFKLLSYFIFQCYRPHVTLSCKGPIEMNFWIFMTGDGKCSAGEIARGLISCWGQSLVNSLIPNRDPFSYEVLSKLIAFELPLNIMYTCIPCLSPQRTQTWSTRSSIVTWNPWPKKMAGICSALNTNFQNYVLSVRIGK